MEAAEVIVETYVRLVKKWFTNTNIVCPGNREIDILAIDSSGQCYHIECSISINEAFSTLNDTPLDEIRDNAARRRSIYYFIERFRDTDIQTRITNDFGIPPGRIQPVVVTWSANENARRIAERQRICIWYLPQIISELIGCVMTIRQHLRNHDRIFQLIAQSMNLKTILKSLNPSIRVAEEVGQQNPFELLQSLCRVAITTAQSRGRQTVFIDDLPV